MKKIVLLIFAIALVVGAVFYFNKNDKIQPKPPELGNKDQLYIRQIDEKKALTQPLDIRKKVYQKSLHGGSAVFVGPYRVELAIYNHENKTAIYGVFIDNSLAMPALPKGSKINIKFDNQNISLIALKDGLMANQAPLPKSLPVKVIVFGTLNNKNFSTNLEISKYRENIINHKVQE